MVAELVRRIMKRIPEENLNKMPENMFKAMKRIMKPVNKMLGNMLKGMEKTMKKTMRSASEQETGEYVQGYENDDEETGEKYDDAAKFTSSHNQLNHEIPSNHRKMGTGVDIENQKHTALSCSHCQGTDRESNWPVLPCSRPNEEGHISLPCPERLAKARKSANPERRPILRRAAITNQSAVMIVIYHHQGPIKIATTKRKIPRLWRRKAQNKKKSLQAAYRAVICKGPHRMQGCPHLPYARCKEEEHISCACPERLLQQQKSRNPIHDHEEKT